MAGRARRPHCGWWAGAGSAVHRLLLRRKLDRPLVILEHTPAGAATAQLLPRSGLIARCGNTPRWSHRWDSEILTLGQLYRDRGDCENAFDELKNQWGWGGFTTHDLEALPTARGQRCVDLQLVEPCSSVWLDLDHRTRGDHQPSIADAGDRAANPTRRAGDTDPQQHARRPTQGTPRHTCGSPASWRGCAKTAGAVETRCSGGIAS